jgi:porphobilinogen synthase
VIDGNNERQAIGSMPGVERLTVDLLVAEIKEAAKVGLRLSLYSHPQTLQKKMPAEPKP